MLWSPGWPGRWRPSDGDSLPLLRLARPWGSHSSLVSPAPDWSCQADTPPHIVPSSPRPLQRWGRKVGNVPGPGYLAAESPTPGAGQRALVCPIPEEEACLYGAELGECRMSTLRISWTNSVGPPWELKADVTATLCGLNISVCLHVHFPYLVLYMYTWGIMSKYINPLPTNDGKCRPGLP